jgi:catechol 2,3-dioxygenase-like lactoylglutathione lyase family enzyme
MGLTGARIFHVNVNCARLEPSRRFYVEALGLTAGVRTAVDRPQPGEAFGLDEAQWDAWIMLGEKEYAGGAIDLLEWQVPEPTGAPPGSIAQCGFQRIGVRVRDIDESARVVTELGGEVWSEPVVHVVDGEHEVRIVMASDPDGTTIELVEGGRGLSFVTVTCANLDRSIAFYERLGFTPVARFPTERGDGAHLRVDGPIAMDEVVLSAPGGGEVILILVGFRTPAPVAALPRAANTVGIWRTALLVPDLDAACATLADLDVATISEPVTMAMGRDLPALRFVCFAGPDGEVVELIEQPT